MRKECVVMLAVMVLSQSVFAQDDNKLDLGIGLEWNMNAHKYFAGGAVLGLTYNLPRSFATGLSVTASRNIADITSAETAAMLRWYFLSKAHAGFFAQADAGVLFYMEKANIGDEIKTLFSGGARGGFRMPLGPSFYIEPYARGGYPFFFSIGVAAGMRFLPVGETPARQAPDDAYVITVTELTTEPEQPIPAEPTEEPQQNRYYIVQRGDTAIIISQKVYGTSYAWDQIAAANNITNPDAIHVGQRLFIPPFRAPDNLPVSAQPEPGKYYMVQRGDTLISISQKVYGNRSGVRRIMEANNITNAQMIHVGRLLLIPSLESERLKE